MIDYYYLSVRKQYPAVAEEEELEITLEELGRIFNCSGRNVNLVLRKMSEAGWIRWIAGRGRGNRSRLVFLMPSEQVVLEGAQLLVRRGDIQGAYAYLEEQKHVALAKERFVSWLGTQFGFHPETTDERTLDILRLPCNKPIDCMDPSLLTFVVECHMVQQIFDGLVKYNEQTRSFDGHIAHFWTSSDTAREWTFYLRKGVYFHHGRELTSDDVRFTVERMRSDQLKSPFRWLFEDVEQVETLGPYAVRFLLKRANPLFLNHLSFDRASIVPRDVVLELGEDFGSKPVGTGPFKVSRHDGNMLVLEAFGRYFDKRAHLDRVEIWYTRDLSFEGGMPGAVMVQLRYQNSPDLQIPENWKTIKLEGRDSSFITFNLNMPGPQHHPAFRKALLYGTDRRRLISPGMQGDTRFSSWFYEPPGPRSDTDVQYDPILAGQLLRESGYAGEALTMCVPVNCTDEIEEIRSQWAELGVVIEYVARMSSKSDYEDVLARSQLAYNCNVLEQEPEMSVLQLFLAENSAVHIHLGQEFKRQADWLIERLYQESSRVTREAYVYRLRELIAEQGYILFLLHHTQRTVYHPSLRNVSLGAMGWPQFHDLWLEPAGPPAL
ncbi:ABC transporter substrate-binding protein [Paenibacillus filicis]|uniref:ABC transporter substrate-binding protein n=1 Tax=Paenibacillus filicis TaxID=669464 RepID=A0ABU9DBW5_9BACL